jgi:hypothetical protein
MKVPIELDELRHVVGHPTAGIGLIGGNSGRAREQAQRKTEKNDESRMTNVEWGPKFVIRHSDFVIYTEGLAIVPRQYYVSHIHSFSLIEPGRRFIDADRALIV